MGFTGAGRRMRQVHDRLYNWYGDRRLGVATRGFPEPHERGVTHPDAMAYSGLEYSHLRDAFRDIPLPPGQVVFVDYGAGKGRALAAAATRPYRKVVGVEISARLAEDARGNLSRL